MNRRRTLLASQADTISPVFLVVGDNGQVGIDLYNYYMSQVPVYDYKNFFPKNGEIMIGEEYVTKMSVENGGDNDYSIFQLYTPTHNDRYYCYVLDSSGVIYEYED